MSKFDFFFNAVVSTVIFLTKQIISKIRARDLNDHKCYFNKKSVFQYNIVNKFQISSKNRTFYRFDRSFLRYFIFILIIVLFVLKLAPHHVHPCHVWPYPVCFYLCHMQSPSIPTPAVAQMANDDIRIRSKHPDTKTHSYRAACEEQQHLCLSVNRSTSRDAADRTADAPTRPRRAQVAVAQKLRRHFSVLVVVAVVARDNSTRCFTLPCEWTRECRVSFFELASSAGNYCSRVRLRLWPRVTSNLGERCGLGALGWSLYVCM